MNNEWFSTRSYICGNSQRNKLKITIKISEIKTILLPTNKNKISLIIFKVNLQL